MRAAIFEGQGRVEVKETDAPTAVKPDDVVIRVVANGICGTDLHGLSVPADVIQFKPGVVVGHEFVGVVEEAGPLATVGVGQRVVAHPMIYCYDCWFCRTGQANLCDNLQGVGIDLDGAAADFCRVPSDRVFAIPDSLPDERAVLAEPLACVLNGIRKAKVVPGESVVILGGGPIGALFVTSLKGAGAQPLIVSEPLGTRREAILGIGADVAVDPTSEDLLASVLDLTEGRGADVVVDTVGFLVPEALGLLRKGGRMYVFGGDLTERQASYIDIPRKEARIEGVFCADDNFPLAIRLLEENSLGYDRLVDARFRLEDFDRAIESARSGEAMKAVLVVDESAIAVE